MKPESKGRVWCNEILHKFETILVGVDNFASQCHQISVASSSCTGLNSVRDDEVEVLPEEDHHSSDNFVTHQCRRPLVLQRPESSSCLPTNWNLNVSEKLRRKEQNKVCSFREKLDFALTCGKKLSCTSLRKLQSGCNQTAAASSPRCKEPTSYQELNKVSSQETEFTHCSQVSDKTGDTNLIPLATEISSAPVEDKVLANSSSSSSSSMKGDEEVDVAPLDTTDLCDVVFPEVVEDDSNIEEVVAAPLDTIHLCDEVFREVDEDDSNIEEVDEAQLDTIDLCDVAFPEDFSDFDDKLLYTALDKTKQLRSFKSKIVDALTSQRRRGEEYEQLAIWFGDAKMGGDLTTKGQAKSQDSEISQSHVPLASDESEWELL